MTTPHADQSCRDCKSRKRRCDKTLPSCSLCTRVGRVCSYERVPEGTAALDVIRARLQQLESQLLSPTALPGDQYGEDESLESDQTGSGGSRWLTGSTSSSSIGVVSPGFSGSSTSHSTISDNHAGNMPVSLFLGFEYFQRANLKLSKPHIAIPQV